MAKTVLVVGGSGYLGQFLVAECINRGWKVAYTHHHAAAVQDQHSAQTTTVFEGETQGYWAELASGDGLQRCLDELGRIDAVINCAAISQPAVCERHPAYARSINVPTTLLGALEAHAARRGDEPLLIHLSTDQVYAGNRAGWREGDVCEPMNEYGKTKLDGERVVAQRWPRHVILRSSLIYGRGPPRGPVGRSLFLQFVDSALASCKPTSFFTDEWRSPIFVGDVVKACTALVDRASAGRSGGTTGTFNMGGLQRLSRMDMAEAVASFRGYDPALVLPAPAASVDRGMPSPSDTSMESSRLWRELNMQPLSFAEALPLIFAAGGEVTVR